MRRAATDAGGSNDTSNMRSKEQQYTNRGFQFTEIEVADYPGEEPRTLQVQESSLASERKVWLGQADGPGHGEPGRRFHLSKDEARQVRDALSRFLGEEPTVQPASDEVPENWDQIKQVSVLLARIADPDSTVTVTEFAQAEAVIKYLSSQPPTREQIAKTLHANDTSFTGERWGDLPPRYRATLTKQALAVLALFQQPTPSTVNLRDENWRSPLAIPGHDATCNTQTIQGVGCDCKLSRPSPSACTCPPIATSQEPEPDENCPREGDKEA